MHRISEFEKSPYYSTVYIFERIPNSTRYLPVKDFKNPLTRYLRDECFYSLNPFYDDTKTSSSSNPQLNNKFNN